MRIRRRGTLLDFWFIVISPCLCMPLGVLCARVVRCCDGVDTWPAWEDEAQSRYEYTRRVRPLNSLRRCRTLDLEGSAVYSVDRV